MHQLYAMDRNSAKILHICPCWPPGLHQLIFYPLCAVHSFPLVRLSPIFVFDLAQSMQRLARQPVRLSASIVLEVRHLYVYG